MAAINFNLSLIIPGVFVVIAGFAIWSSIRSKSGGGKSPAHSITQAAEQRKSPRWLIPFFGVFFLAGVGMLIALLILPVVRIVQGRSWVPMPCRIVSCRVQSHGGSKGETYSVEIVYEYRVAGKVHRCDRWDFFPPSSSSGYGSKMALAIQYPAGRELVCYVNPANLDQAVLNRQIDSRAFLGLIALPFLLIGGGGMYFMLRGKRGATASPAAAWMPKQASLPAARSSSRRGKVLGAIFAAFFWNGIVSVFVVMMIGTWRQGNPSYFLTFFLIPFEIAGVMLLGTVVYQILACFNPRVQLDLGRDVLRPGDSTDLRWEFGGRYDRITHLRITLEGREEATYCRGTSTYTDKNVFTRMELADVTQSYEIRSGRVKVRIPDGVMHSLAADNNKVIWVIRVQGEIPRWPDVEDEFPVALLPAMGRGAQAIEEAEEHCVGKNESLMITTGRRKAFAPGEEVSGEAVWQFIEPIEAIELRLFWYTAGKGTGDVQIVEVQRFESPGSHQRRAFRFKLPEGPCSFSGKLISLSWALELVALPSGQSQRLEFALSPCGREINLEAIGLAVQP